MIKTIILFLFINPFLNSSDLKKVASYSISNYGNERYESFGFWINNKNKQIIHYRYGKDDKEVPVKYLGKSQLNGEVAFKILIDNKITLYATQEGDKLRLRNLSGTYNKLFLWTYEGPVNGIGTYCEPCTQDEEESKSFLSKYYF